MRIDPLTCSIGAGILGVNLDDAARNADLFAEIKELLLKHRVLFLRDQDISRAEHVAFARRFGELEGHPVAAQRIFSDINNILWHQETNHGRT